MLRMAKAASGNGGLLQKLLCKTDLLPMFLIQYLLIFSVGNSEILKDADKTSG